jgi:hypothetical protein
VAILSHQLVLHYKGQRDARWGRSVNHQIGNTVLRAGGGAIAATTFAAGLLFCLWSTSDSAPANAELREDRSLSIVRAVDTRPKSALSSFGDRFVFEKTKNSRGSLQLTASFDDRFLAQIKGPDATAHPSGVPGQRIPAGTTARSAAVRTSAAPVVPKRVNETRVQLASASAIPVSLSYAAAASAPSSGALTALPPNGSKPLSDFDTSRTAIYEITSQTVYLPDGRRLEAHSGFGDQMDDPRYVSIKNTGPTPPNVYVLKLRESHFRGDRAIRLIPTDRSKMYGRDGILAHSYLLGQNGQSNGCVSFADYPAFLEAFLRGEIDRLVVVERLANPPEPRTAMDWLKDLFRRS